jgi:hypothetical protein
MLRFENHQDFVEIDLAKQETADLPSKGDAYLTIRISSAGFTGHNDVWVLAPAFRCFCQALIALERDRRGEAVLLSISPGKLRLVIRSVDSCGHTLVEGSTGHGVKRENSRLWHFLDFGFEFDPSQLQDAVRVDWVKRNSATGSRTAAEIQDSIRQILYHEWDPIGVAGSAPGDEYDSYIGPVYRILVGTRSEQELVEFLFRTARDTMGLGCGASGTTEHYEKLRPIARRLLALDVKL